MDKKRHTSNMEGLQTKEVYVCSGRDLQRRVFTNLDYARAFAYVKNHDLGKEEYQVVTRHIVKHPDGSWRDYGPTIHFTEEDPKLYERYQMLQCPNMEGLHQFFQSKQTAERVFESLSLEQIEALDSLGHESLGQMVKTEKQLRKYRNKKAKTENPV